METGNECEFVEPTQPFERERGHVSAIGHACETALLNTAACVARLMKPS